MGRLKALHCIFAHFGLNSQTVNMILNTYWYLLGDCGVKTLAHYCGSESGLIPNCGTSGQVLQQTVHGWEVGKDCVLFVALITPTGCSRCLSESEAMCYGLS